MSDNINHLNPFEDFLPKQTNLLTERLLLRPMTMEDAPTIHRLVNDKDICYGCVHIPYPYPEGAAEAWISGHPFRFMQQHAAIFAITKDGEIIGATGIELKFAEERYYIGYWIGKEFWGNGYASEAAKRLIEYGLDTLQIPTLYAECLEENTASLNVLRKIGMKEIALVHKPCHSPTKEEPVVVFQIDRDVE